MIEFAVPSQIDITKTQDDESMQLALAMSTSEQTAVDQKKNAVDEVSKIVSKNNFQMLRRDCGGM